MCYFIGRKDKNGAILIVGNAVPTESAATTNATKEAQASDDSFVVLEVKNEFRRRIVVEPVAQNREIG